MTKETDLRRERQCTFLMRVHEVLVAKHRRKIGGQEAIEKLRSYFASVGADVERVERDGEGEHVHWWVNTPPK